MIVGSKGGFPKHPAWYLNIQDGGEVAFQIATQAFKATWREPKGEERKAVWRYMVDCFPPYKDYPGGDRPRDPDRDDEADRRDRRFRGIGHYIQTAGLAAHAGAFARAADRIGERPGGREC